MTSAVPTIQAPAKGVLDEPGSMPVSVPASVPRSTPGPTPARASGSRWDLLAMGAGAILCLVVSFVLSHGRIFWEDEMLGWMLLRDPSWSHMVHAWQLGADGGGFSFYVTGRLWLTLFGASAHAFRLYSATCFALAFCFTWLTARRFYRPGVVAFALFNTWFFSPPLVTHLGEGRFYGLLVLATSLVAWWTAIRLQRDGLLPPWAYLVTFLLHGLLITSHALGILYSAALFAAMLLLDRLRARSRPWLYLASSVAWLLLLPEREALRASSEVGKPHFWTLPPNMSRFLGAFTAFSAEIALVLALLGVALAWSLLRQHESTGVRLRRAFRDRRPIYVISAALLLVPVGLAMKSFFGTSLFINRYLMPVTLAIAFVTAEAITLIDWTSITPQWTRTGESGATSRFLRPALLVTYATTLLLWDFVHLAHFAVGQRDYTGKLTRRLPQGVPVLCEDAWTFTEIIGRQHSSGVRYTYLLDWPQSISAAAPRLEVTQYHLMENWRKVGYFSGSIADRDNFLRTYPAFLILHYPNVAKDEHGPIIGNPLVERFAHDPAYQVSLSSPGSKSTFEIWQVRRR